MERCALIDFDRYVEQAKSYGEWPGGHVDMSSGRIDGLSYRLYRHTAESEDVILVYHGGGVNSAAGYDVLARQLAAEPTLAVCLVDIRGHGDSTGERGRLSGLSVFGAMSISSWQKCAAGFRWRADTCLAIRAAPACCSTT